MANDRSPMNRVLGAIAGPVVGAVDPDALLERVDVENLIERIDVDALIQRVDLDGLLLRIDVNALMERIDIDSLMGRVDIDGLMGRVDIDGLMGRVDIDGMLDRVDLPALVKRAGIDDIVSDAATGVATRVLDLVRRQLLGLDTVWLGLVDRVARRDRAASDAPVTGRPAGPISRLAAFAFDWVLITVLFSATVSVATNLLELFTQSTINPRSGHEFAWAVGFVSWAFTYFWISLAIAGRTPGKALIGLRVMSVSGGPVKPWNAAVRTLVMPISCIFALGLIPAAVGKQRRALHDFAAGTNEVVDWGIRDASLPSPLHRWLEKNGAAA